MLSQLIFVAAFLITRSQAFWWFMNPQILPLPAPAGNPGLPYLANLLTTYSSPPFTSALPNVSNINIVGSLEKNNKAGYKMNYVFMGNGIQQFLCNNQNHWTPNGYFAELFDVSGIVSYGINQTYLPLLAYQFLPYPSASADNWNIPVAMTLGSVPYNPVGTSQQITPYFQLQQGPKAGSATYYSVTQRGTPSFNATDNAPWWELKGVMDGTTGGLNGNVAQGITFGASRSQVYMTDTYGGYLPLNCPQVGAPITVNFSAMFYFTTWL